MRFACPFHQMRRKAPFLENGEIKPRFLLIYSDLDRRRVAEVA